MDFSTVAALASLVISLAALEFSWRSDHRSKITFQEAHAPVVVVKADIESNPLWQRQSSRRRRGPPSEATVHGGARCPRQGAGPGDYATWEGQVARPAVAGDAHRLVQEVRLTTTAPVGVARCRALDSRTPIGVSHPHRTGSRQAKIPTMKDRNVNRVSAKGRTRPVQKPLPATGAAGAGTAKAAVPVTATRGGGAAVGRGGLAESGCLKRRRF